MRTLAVLGEDEHKKMPRVITRASFTAHGAIRSIMFRDGKGIKKSRISKEIRENFHEIGVFLFVFPFCELFIYKKGVLVAD